MDISIVAVITTLLAVLAVGVAPFVPGRIELASPKDDSPLSIDSDVKYAPELIARKNLKKNAQFTNIYAKKIQTYRLRTEARPFLERCIVPNGIVLHERIRIKENTEVLGDIRSWKDVVVGENVVVHGSVFADGKILLGKNSTVLGNVFSQGNVIVCENCTVGVEGRIRSIVSHGVIVLRSGVSVYGYISCAEGYVT